MGQPKAKGKREIKLGHAVDCAQCIASHCAASHRTAPHRTALHRMAPTLASAKVQITSRVSCFGNENWVLGLDRGADVFLTCLPPSVDYIDIHTDGEK